jgi:hypothetical protein
VSLFFSLFTQGEISQICIQLLAVCDGAALSVEVVSLDIDELGTPYIDDANPNTAANRVLNPSVKSGQKQSSSGANVHIHYDGRIVINGVKDARTVTTHLAAQHANHIAKLKTHVEEIINDHHRRNFSTV